MKTRGDFHFKKFSVSHDQATHKVGTDGVLLGAWANVQHAKQILDIGTGSGVIALMLAQRTDGMAIIDAIEIQEDDARVAKENVARSPWPLSIVVNHTSLQDFQPPHSYDLIVTNPPFFINSSLPPTEKRSKARHTQELSFDDILGFAAKSLKPDGILSIILPEAEADRFIALATNYSLHIQRRVLFRSRKHKSVERVLMEFGIAQLSLKQSELLLYLAGDSWTPEYRALMKDFLLKA